MAKKQKKKRQVEEVNASSMADIAFLLLIFFLVTTTILNEKGLPIKLPQKAKDTNEAPEKPVHARNIFNVLINSGDKLLVEDRPMDIYSLRSEAKRFITNRKSNPDYSDSPKDAIISFRGDRGTSFGTYIQVVDELKGAYHELWAEELDMDVDELLALDVSESENAKLINLAKKVYPMQLAEAEPEDFGK